MIKKIVIALSIFLLFSGVFINVSNADEGLSIQDFYNLLDVEHCFIPFYICVPLGCGCNIHGCYDLVCHTYPRAVIETVKQPFTTALPLIGKIMQSLSKTLTGNLGGSGGAQQGSTHGTNSYSYDHFFDAHVVNLPFLREMLVMRLPAGYRLCYWDETLSVKYVSEIDSVNWRTGLSDFMLGKSFLSSLASMGGVCSVAFVVSPLSFLGDICVGTWGAVYPRVGGSQVVAEITASAYAAYRALRVVAKPLGRIVFSPESYKTAGLLQIAYGTVGGGISEGILGGNCILPGESPLLWTWGKSMKPEGTGYIWIWWEYKCCCKLTNGCVGVGGF